MKPIIKKVEACITTVSLSKWMCGSQTVTDGNYFMVKTSSCLGQICCAPTRVKRNMDQVFTG
jgi:hypothetical protein